MSCITGDEPKYIYIYVYIIRPRHIFYDVMVFDRKEEEGCRSDRLVSDIGSSVHHDAGGRRWQVDARLDSENKWDSGRVFEVCPDSFVVQRNRLSVVPGASDAILNHEANELFASTTTTRLGYGLFR